MFSCCCVNRWLQRFRGARQKLHDLFCAQSNLIHTTKKKKPHKLWNNLSGRFFRSKELDTSGLRCQRSGMLKEQISSLLGDKILDQSFQNGNFSPKPDLTQEYLTSTWRSPLRESHVTNISWHYKFPHKIQILHIKLIGLVDR